MPALPLDHDAWQQLRDRYRERFPVGLQVCSPSGEPQFGDPVPGDHQHHAQAIAEALRFGEPVVIAGDAGAFLWAVPLMHNAATTGGLCTGVREEDLFPRGLAEPRFDVRQACHVLLELCVQANVCNDALLGQRRDLHRREADRARALHQVKLGSGRALRDVYLREEADLLGAIRRGDRGAARAIINRTLVVIYHHGAHDRTLRKSLLLELLVMMVRGAVESGGDHTDLFAAQSGLVADLEATADEEELAHWLREAVEQVCDAIERQGPGPADQQCRRALQIMADSCDDPDLGRDTVAERVGIGPTALSRLIKKQTGRGFGDQLNQLRIDQAKMLLRDTDLSLLHIALDCGFKDPSYFTKVFRRHADMTPTAYRQANRRGDRPA